MNENEAKEFIHGASHLLCEAVDRVETVMKALREEMAKARSAAEAAWRKDQHSVAILEEGRAGGLAAALEIVQRAFEGAYVDPKKGSDASRTQDA